MSDSNPAPPPPIDRSNWLYAPHLRYGFQHVQSFVRTARIGRGPGPVTPLQDAAAPMPPVVFNHGGRPMTLDEALAATHTDALLVLHEGAVAFEHYTHGMRRDSLHLLMSCTKSVVGTLTGVLLHSGKLSLDARVVDLLPALGDSAFAEGTVRQLLDMNVGTAFDENYADPDSQINQLDFAIGWRDRPRDYDGPMHLLAALNELDTLAFEHGHRFSYRSPVTDVLGLVLERASRLPLAELIRETLWAPLGCEWDACITVDDQLAPLANGGLCTTLRDFARFGQLVLDRGQHLGEALIPADWIDDCRHGDAHSIGAWQISDYADRAPAGNYRNQWWCRNVHEGVLMASGIHGQNLYIDPVSRTVIAKFSSQPEPRNDAVFNLQFALLEAIARAYR